jgi:ubiquinone/menaquinone biosynthesis C-methylase UbiE
VWSVSRLSPLRFARMTAQSGPRLPSLQGVKYVGGQSTPAIQPTRTMPTMRHRHMEVGRSLAFALESDHYAARQTNVKLAFWRVRMNQQEARLLRNDYVLGHSADEYQRLRRQAETFESVTARLFRSIGLQPGWRCLDLGCGPGETMRMMGEIVGPSGEVTGLDRDAEAGRKAIERLRATGTSRYRFIEADMETTDEVSGGLFDLTFARLSLLYSRDPVAVLRRMHRWTKPGGCVAVQDLYARTINLYPKLEACSELTRVILETCERSGQDMEFAFKLPIYFVEAGIGVPDGTDINLPMTSFEAFMLHHEALCRSLLPRAIELGITTQARMQGVFRDIERAAADGRLYSALWPAMIGVWKHKSMLI